MKKPLLQWMGLLGIISLLSYSAAVIFSPLAYPGYDWMSQAVSDLMTNEAPSRMLWNQLASLYGVCGMISIMMVCVFINGKLTKTIRIGIYIFALMNWVSCIGYAMFPLTSAGTPQTLQDIMHVFVVTPLVVVLSIVSLLMIIIGGYKDKKYTNLGRWAALAFLLMLAGAIGVGIVPPSYFGIPERFSVFFCHSFQCDIRILFIYGFFNKERRETISVIEIVFF